MATGIVYWMHGRTFIACREGRKFVTGLIIEADGLHALRVPVGERLTEAQYKGQPYPARKMRGHLRSMKAATKGAAKLKWGLLA